MGYGLRVKGLGFMIYDLGFRVYPPLLPRLLSPGVSGPHPLCALPIRPPLVCRLLVQGVLVLGRWVFGFEFRAEG